MAYQESERLLEASAERGKNSETYIFYPSFSIGSFLHCSIAPLAQMRDTIQPVLIHRPRSIARIDGVGVQRLAISARTIPTCPRPR